MGNHFASPELRLTAPQMETYRRLGQCAMECLDQSPVTEFERRRHAQLVAEEMARYHAKRRDLFTDNGPQDAA